MWWLGFSKHQVWVGCIFLCLVQLLFIKSCHHHHLLGGLAFLTLRNPSSPSLNYFGFCYLFLDLPFLSFCALPLRHLTPPQNKCCYALKKHPIRDKRAKSSSEQKKAGPGSIQVSSFSFICSRTEGVHECLCQADARFVVLPRAVWGAALRRISLFSHVKLSLTPAEFDKSPSCVKAE